MNTTGHTDRYLVYRCGRMGLGHVLITVFNCLRAAHDSGRILALDLSSFQYFREQAHELFFENFAFEIPEDVRLETDLARVNAICADADRYEAPAWRGRETDASRPERVVIINHDVIRSVHTPANKFDFWPCRLVLRGALAGRVAPALLKPDDATATIGIYFRSGNGEFLGFRFDEVTLPDYAPRYQEVLARYVDVARVAASAFPGKRIRYFVASDSPDFVREMRRRLNNVSRGAGGLSGIYQKAVAASNAGLDAIADAVIDLWNLSACDSLIFSPSLFPRLAILNSATLTPDNTWELELSTVRSVIHAMPESEAIAYLTRSYWRTPADSWQVKAGYVRFHAGLLRRYGRETGLTALEQREAALEACFACRPIRDANDIFLLHKPDEALAMASAGALPRDAYALLFVATLQAFLGDHAAALERVRAASAILPVAPEPYLLESQLLAAQGDVEAAAAAAARGLAACGPEPPLCAQRALLASCLRPHGALLNVAVNKPAAQSSRSNASNPDDPQCAVNAVFARNFQFQTLVEENPWWQVDLGAIEAVRRIIVYNREDATTECADGLVLEGSAEGETFREIGRASYRFTGFSGGNPLDVWFDEPLPLRHVRLRLEGTRALHLQQVAVYAEREHRRP